MNVTALKGKTIGFAGSGGLDSCTITRWLTDNGVKVVCFTGDLGQPDESSMDSIRDRMIACGAADFVVLDLRQALAVAGVKVIQSQAFYEGRYWNTTGIARHVLIEGMIPEMRKRGISILSHGATGRGNDQVRFQLATNMLAPDFKVYAPWRDQAFLDQFGGRTEMIDFCESKKLPIVASKQRPYSTDANLLGLTHEAGKLEALATPARFIEAKFGCHAPDAPDRAEEFSVRFEKGIPVQINGKKVGLIEAFDVANTIGGKHGVGIGVHVVENRFVGIKSRGVYETPAIELLGSCYEYLLQLVLDRRARELFESLSRLVAKQIYQGYWFDLATQMAMRSIDMTAQLATGTVKVSLYKGTISYVYAGEAPNTLYSEDTASMEKVGTYDHTHSEGLLEVLGVSARALAAAGQISQ